MVDAVASFMGAPVKADEWQIDAVVGGSQKCLGALPGMSLVTFNDRFADEINKRKRSELGVRGEDAQTAANFVPSNYLDLTQLQDYWSPARVNHHTEATIGIYGVHEALRLGGQEEGLANRFARHQQVHQALNNAVKALGLTIFNEGDHEIPMVTCVEIPEALRDTNFQSELLTKFGVEIAASFGSLQGKIWRLGTMGYVAQKGYLVRFISIFGAALLQAGYPADVKAALDAVDQAFA